MHKQIIGLSSSQTISEDRRVSFNDEIKSITQVMQEIYYRTVLTCLDMKITLLLESMSTLFISDLHLSANQPPLTHLFLNFLQTHATKAEALYILGDLFESWIGDDNETLFHQQITSALAELSASGVHTYFMPGNRDFLIGQRFIKKTRFKLLKDPSFIVLYGIPTLLTHGDSWCTLDKRYVYFRRLTRTHFLQSFFLKLPLFLREKIAAYLRGNNHVGMTNDPRFDIVMNELHRCLKDYPAQLIIHGHTHQPCIQLFQTHSQSTESIEHVTFHTRIVLSDWTPSKGNVLVVTPERKFKLIYFS
ncbi:MAG: UDP-2,3-diacylglucosamine diphosphatase [Rickettsiella sp.]|nr:UDP-2,3-diacylglucosamine diphosphatase [Rickettsiella sp.]